MDFKTPVTLLHEFLAINRHPPAEFILHENVLTDPMKPERKFEYEVKAFGGLKARGSGFSKKVAKHECAKNILFKIAETESSLKEYLATHRFDENLETIRQPRKDDFVGALINLCVTNQMDLPKFDKINEEGPSNDRVFTMKCEIKTWKTEGIAKSLKMAKQKAADKMMTYIKENVKHLKTDVPASSMSNIYDCISEEVEKEKNIVVEKLKAQEVRTLKDNDLKLSKLHLYPGEPEAGVVQIMNQIKTLRRFYTHDEFIQALPLYSLDNLKQIINEINETKLIKIDTVFLESRIYFCFCRCALKKISMSFYDSNPNKDQAEKNTYIKLLSDFSSYKLNTGDSRIYGDSSDEE